MAIVFADFETYYDREYSLSKMTPAEYILDPRFAVHGCAIIAQTPEGYAPPRWLDPQECKHYFGHTLHNEKNTVLVTFNALFDMCIVGWHYGYVPDLMVDVMGLCRAAVGPASHRFSLDAMAQYFEIGKKGDLNTIGRTTEQLHLEGLHRPMVEYALNDVALTQKLYARLRGQFAPRELKFADLVLRCAIEPKLRYDKKLLEDYLLKTKSDKQALLNACGTDKPSLMSAAKFQHLLEQEGVLVEQKLSPAGKYIPALAKTDTFIQDLLEHDNPKVAALAAARLGLKSTLEETRCQRMLTIAALPPVFTAMTDAMFIGGGCAPIPLRYGATHTHRLGGEWKLNKQNLPRTEPDPDNPTKRRPHTLRRALVPLCRGESVIVADLRQIEPRMSAWFCGAQNLLDEFAARGDPYASLASEIFGFPVNRKIHVVEGFIGKTGILGLGYGAGAPKFHSMVHTQARVQLGFDVDFTEASAYDAVMTYRRKYKPIPDTWYWGDKVALPILMGGGAALVRGPLTITKETITGPNGLALHYPELHWDAARQEIVYRNGKMWPSLYGAKLLENIIQFLSRIVLSEAAVTLANTYVGGKALRFSLSAHDELGFVVDDGNVKLAEHVIYKVLTTCPAWCAGVPLDAEVKSGPNYGDAK